MRFHSAWTQSAPYWAELSVDQCPGHRRRETGYKKKKKTSPAASKHVYDKLKNMNLGLAVTGTDHVSPVLHIRFVGCVQGQGSDENEIDSCHPRIVKRYVTTT